MLHNSNSGKIGWVRFRQNIGEKLASAVTPKTRIFGQQFWLFRVTVLLTVDRYINI